jgi:hypothetical protein
MSADLKLGMDGDINGIAVGTAEERRLRGRRPRGRGLGAGAYVNAQHSYMGALIDLVRYSPSIPSQQPS